MDKLYKFIVNLIKSMNNNFFVPHQLQTQLYFGYFPNPYSFQENLNFGYFYPFDPSAEILPIPY